MVELVGSPPCCIMIFLAILFASLANVNAQVRPIDPRSNDKPQSEWKMVRAVHPPTKPDTVIENKNVNIIVNVDPKDVAKELWSLIQSRLDGRQGRRSLPHQHTLDELERIVTPMIAPTRRSHRPTAFEVAYALDHVTRKALLSDHLKRPTIDDEIDTREIVARMLYKLKLITEQEEMENNEELTNFRKMLNFDNDSRKNDDSLDENDDPYINIIMKIRKSELLKGKPIYTYDDS